MLFNIIITMDVLHESYFLYFPVITESTRYMYHNNFSLVKHVSVSVFAFFFFFSFFFTFLGKEYYSVAFFHVPIFKFLFLWGVDSTMYHILKYYMYLAL